MIPRLLAVSLLVSLTASGQSASSTTEGTLTVEGKIVRLVIACAYEDPDPFDENKTRIALVLAGAPKIDAASCRETYRLIGARMAATPDGPPALVAYLEQPGFAWRSGMLLAKGSTYSYSLSTAGTASGSKLKFDLPPGPADTTILAGRLYTSEPIQLADWPATSVDVQISAPLEKLAPKTQEITGEGAGKHPAAIAAKGFLTAMSKGDEKAVRSYIVEGERPRFDQMMASGDKAKFLGMMQEMSKDALSMRELKVGGRGALTIVTFQRNEEGGRASAEFYLRQEQGEWRITQQR